MLYVNLESLTFNPVLAKSQNLVNIRIARTGDKNESPYQNLGLQKWLNSQKNFDGVVIIEENGEG